MSYDSDFMMKFYKDSYKTSSFHGKVLLLGMGSAIIPRLFTTHFEKMIIIENDIHIYNKYKHYLPENCEVLIDDIYQWKSDEKFDVIVIDIWAKFVEENDVNKVKNLYINNLDVGGEFLWTDKIVRK